MVAAVWTAAPLSTVVWITYLRVWQSTTGTPTRWHTRVVQHASQTHNSCMRHKMVWSYFCGNNRIKNVFLLPCNDRSTFHTHNAMKIFKTWHWIGSQALTTLRDLWPEINADSVFRAEISIVRKCCTQAVTTTTTCLVAALLQIDVWADITMTWCKHIPREHVTLRCIEHWRKDKQQTQNLS